jgi:hypothetical protein
MRWVGEIGMVGGRVVGHVPGGTRGTVCGTHVGGVRLMGSGAPNISVLLISHVQQFLDLPVEHRILGAPLLT